MTARALAMSRAVGVIAATTAIVTGITFAQLNTTATLAGTTITTASADLTVWDGANFVSTAPGFTISNLIPGQNSGWKPFYLRNGGAANLALTAQVPIAPAATGFTGWNNVTVWIRNSATNDVVTTDMGTLLAGAVNMPGNPLPGNAQGDSGVYATPGNYEIAFDIAPAAVTGSSASIGAFNIVLTGTVTP